MYRIFAAGFLVVTLIGVALATAPVSRAVTGEQGQLKPDDTSLYNMVTMDCLAVKFKLNETHRQDKLLRVTLGQGYDNMSTNLMGRFNSRIVENKLDGGELIKIAAEFEQARQNFRDDYTKYDDAFTNLLKSDCQSQTQTYYVNLQSMRELRTKVNNDTKKLDEIMGRYYDAFGQLRKSLTEKQAEEERNNAAE